MTPSKIIGLVGASGSGKTTIARDLAALADSSCMISQDNYYFSLPNNTDAADWNFDDPSSIDLEHLARDLQQLKRGIPVEGPRYIFADHLRASDTLTLRPAPVIIVEGLFLFTTEHLREVFDVKIFVDVPLELCLERRVRRDVTERGRSEQMIRNRWTRQVEPMFRKHVEPTLNFADIVLHPAPLHTPEYDEQLQTIRKL